MIVVMPPFRHDDTCSALPRLPDPARSGRTGRSGLLRRPGRPPRFTSRGRPPVVTYTVIALCTAVFLVSPLSGLAPVHRGAQAQLCAQAVYFAHWGVIPSELLHGGPAPAALAWPPGCPPPARLAPVPLLSALTTLFVHGGWLHLTGNMLFLYVFGAGVEERMGRVGFALFYLAAGIVATFGYALGQADSTQTLVGASGAIAGVLGAYLFLYPGARVTSLFPFLLFLPLRFPAWVVLGFWFVLQWLAARTDGTGPGIAYLAHVIGFTFGFLCAAATCRRRTKLSPQAATRGDSQP